MSPCFPHRAHSRYAPPSGLRRTFQLCNPSRHSSPGHCCVWSTRGMLKLLLGDVDLLSGGLEQAAEYLARAPSNSTKRPAHPSARHYQWSGWPRSRSPAGSGGARTPPAAGASPGTGQPSRATSARARPRHDDPGRPNLPRSIAAVQRADTARPTATCAAMFDGLPGGRHDRPSACRSPPTSPGRGWRRPSGSPACGRAAMARRHLEGSRRAPPLRRRPYLVLQSVRPVVRR
jgi:hypothetical protein